MTIKRPVSYKGSAVVDATDFVIAYANDEHIAARIADALTNYTGIQSETTLHKDAIGPATAAHDRMVWDAVRYRWLRDKRLSGRGIPSLATYAGDSFVSLVTWDASAADTDAAIDRAMEPK